MTQVDETDAPEETQIGDVPDGEENQGEAGLERTLDPPPLQAPDLYTPDKCTIHLTITMLPCDGQGEENEHPILLGVRNDSDTPLIAMTRACGLAALLPQLEQLYEQIVAELPQRQVALSARLEAERKRGQAGKTAPPRKETKAAAPEKQKADLPQTPAPPVEKQATNKRGGKQSVESDLEQLSLF